ncbi:MAG TPA: tripartite tricarboxylate transporter substrate binding protein [Pseudolabrys sp.]|nr:tripartite tricarboxylate transporter substrate binding protein [Pseudolabrys sp.]
MFRFLLFLAMALSLSSVTAQAQQYPDHPVRVVVGYAAGGGPDIQARTLAAQLSLDLGQQFFVENRVGANGTIGTRAVVQSKPDGYTLLFSSNGIAPTPFIYKNLGYDVFTDLTPIATIGVLDGLFMLVDEKSSYKTLQEFLDHAKKDRAVFGSPGVGNGLHLAAEIFSKKAGITMQHVPYKGASEVMTGMLSGSIEVMFVTPPSVLGLLKDGRVRALAFTGSKPFPAFPDVPLMKEMLPGFEPIGSWGMIFAPAKTPPEIVEKLNAAVRAALQAPAVASAMQRDGYVPDNRNVAETAAYFRQEVKLMGEAVKAAGIEPN